MPKKIVITGATGLIGREISRKLISKGEDVIIFSRSPENAKKLILGGFDYTYWDYRDIKGWRDKLESADAVLHLAGENLMNKRWSGEHKKRVKESRIESTKAMVEAIKSLKTRPEVFVSASAIGYYDDSVDKSYDENSGPGDGFMPDLVSAWEKEAETVESNGVRRVNIRTGIVLDKKEGALPRMLLPYNFFVGGPLGEGNQWIPWIHIDDIAELFIFPIYNDEAKGTFNGVAPDYLTMNDFSYLLGKILKRPSFFRVPGFILKIVLGEAADVVLKGSKVIPRRTIEIGFQYKFNDAEEALKDLLLNR